MFDDLINFLSRLVRDSDAFNTLDSRTIQVFFHKSPGWAESDARGIQGLDYEVVAGGTTVQSGTTGADGKIEVPVTGGRAELRLTFNGAPVASYRLVLRSDAFEAGDNILGVQRRFRTLGYHLGHLGDDEDGIDGDLGRRTDRAILDFQIDHQLDLDGVVGPNTRGALNRTVGGSAAA